jgi:hypothetical protein
MNSGYVATTIPYHIAAAATVMIVQIKSQVFIVITIVVATKTAHFNRRKHHHIKSSMLVPYS